MRILNCLWSAEAAFKSVHLVHSNFIAAVKPEYQANIFLLGDASKQKDLEFAESFYSSKKATRKTIASYFYAESGRVKYNRLIRTLSF